MTKTTQDAVQKFGSNSRGAEYGFLPAVAYALEEFGKKNNGPLYNLQAIVKGKTIKGFTVVSEGEENIKLTQFETPLKRVLDRALSDVKFIFKDGKVTCKVGEQGGLNHDVLRELQDTLKFWDNKLTVKGDTFKAMFPAPAKAKDSDDKEAKRQKALENFRKYCAKMSAETGLSMDALKAAMDAKPTNTVDH